MLLVMLLLVWDPNSVVCVNVRGCKLVVAVVDVVRRIGVGNSFGIKRWKVVSPEARELINAS